ncbi:hypothetical protein LX99_02179 [Mucilaginibacter oryzae]|uniref:Glycosyl hydrolase family 36 n=1 Tax=Mucilaginibacter oryzae TaxID=468058 RepID=A0A316HD47_9SPHI|nr:hypothetical protein [Mucilaginibacter oryzae]PWK78337.1 hypothetical protein LX99_02179 [Mucilaginibacter oryzae]
MLSARKLQLTLGVLSFLYGGVVKAQSRSDQRLAYLIMNDHRMDTIQKRALALLNGFSAGTSYNEVWIRDFNTFINGAIKVQGGEKVKEMLLLFFRMQGSGGDIVDGLVDTARAHVGYNYRYSKSLPGWAAHKNTVETDQESSLIQAVKKYIDVTGDRAILSDQIDGRTVIARMEDALNYIVNERWSARYGLVKGATTIDWGDVQPENGWGVNINKKTKWAIDVYDNAMFAKAVYDFIAMMPGNYKPFRNWSALAARLKASVRRYLWDSDRQKYIPHLFLGNQPFSGKFDERRRIYTGGSICAIIAGFNTPAEVKEINRQMLAAAAHEKFATIGITVYPPYPKDEYPNMPPYVYQNAGDWTWFGGRVVGALLPYKLVNDAYNDLQPMLQRTIDHQGFYEWYDVQNGTPKGSGDFRGEAGVLYDAIVLLREWALVNK